MKLQNLPRTQWNGLLLVLVGVPLMKGHVHSQENKPLSAHSSPQQTTAASKAYPAAESAANAVLTEWDSLKQSEIILSEDKKQATIKFPSEISALDGQKVAIIGFMAPFEKLDDLSTCMLLPASVGCYYCAPPPVTQVALIQQKNEKQEKRPFIGEAIIVTGTLRLFSLESQHPAHQADFLYALDDATVEVFTGENKPIRAAAHLPPDPRKQPKVY